MFRRASTFVARRGLYTYASPHEKYAILPNLSECRNSQLPFYQDCANYVSKGNVEKALETMDTYRKNVLASPRDVDNLSIFVANTVHHFFSKLKSFDFLSSNFDLNICYIKQIDEISYLR
jgi:hypothetical protein